MKSALFLVLWLAVNAAHAYVPFERFNSEHAQLGHCYTTKYNVGALEKYEEKQVVIDGVCGVAHCTESRAIIYKGCKAVLLSKKAPCQLKRGDNSKPYPECCYKLDCIEENPANKLK